MNSDRIGVFLRIAKKECVFRNADISLKSQYTNELIRDYASLLTRCIPTKDEVESC